MESAGVEELEQRRKYSDATLEIRRPGDHGTTWSRRSSGNSITKPLSVSVRPLQDLILLVHFQRRLLFSSCNILYIYHFAPGTGAKYCDQSICLSVCMYVCLSAGISQKNRMPKCHDISVHITYDRGLVLITALWPVLSSHPAEGRRLSWPGWLICTPEEGLPSQYQPTDRHRRSVSSKLSSRPGLIQSGEKRTH